MLLLNIRAELFLFLFSWTWGCFIVVFYLFVCCFFVSRFECWGCVWKDFRMLPQTLFLPLHRPAVDRCGIKGMKKDKPGNPAEKRYTISTVHHHFFPQMLVHGTMMALERVLLWCLRICCLVVVFCFLLSLFWLFKKSWLDSCVQVLFCSYVSMITLQSL